MAIPPCRLPNRRMGCSARAKAPSPIPAATPPPRPLPDTRMSISTAAGDPDFPFHASPPPNPQQQQDHQHSPMSNVTPFRPSIAIVVGVLTTMFSITFLLLLYAKHCKRGSGARNGANGPGGPGFPNNLPAARRNSGVDRCVVESLPLFRFGVLVGQKVDGGGGLECAVCLNRFDPAELLRLLPKCKHAFHVECVDTWLDAHSTCPLCRCRVDPEDAFLIPAADPKLMPQPQAPAECGGVDGAGGEPPAVPQQQRRDGEPEEDRQPDDGDNKPAAAGAAVGDDDQSPSAASPAPAAANPGGTNHSGCGPFNLRGARPSFSLTGRHSSAGEKSSGTALLQVVVEKPGRRKSIDDATLRNAASAAQPPLRRKDRLLLTTTDRAPSRVPPLRRKDRLLLTTTDRAPSRTPPPLPAAATMFRSQEELERRFGHCIVVSNTSAESAAAVQEQRRRWSDLKPSDLLVLRREMILSAAESARYSASSSAAGRGRISWSSSAFPSPLRTPAIDGRSASEITGLSRQVSAPRPAAIQEEREQALRSKWQGFSAWRTGLWPTARGGRGGGGQSNAPSR